MSKVILDFLEQYEKQYDFYRELAEKVKGIIEDQFEKKGIKAIVSARAKSYESLRNKVEKRNLDKKYKNINEVYNDIVDLSGVRVALYFPSNRDVVDTIIHDSFNIQDERTFPREVQRPNHQKRFSGYWAKHYRINLKIDSIKEKRYSSASTEIQVASLLMHAWSEIEHDLVYKPIMNEASTEELAILDEVNGLVLAGEIALERLQMIRAQQTMSNPHNVDQYDISNYLIKEIANYSNKNIKIGDIKFLNDVFIRNNYFSLVDISKSIKSIDSNSNETISDQLIYNILMSQYISQRKNKERKEIQEKNKSLYEQFIKYWITIEKSVYQISEGLNVHSNKFNPEILISQGIIDSYDLEKIVWIRKIRNNTVHGKENPSDELLMELIIEQKRIIKKIINSISDFKLRDILMKDFDSI